MEQAAIVNVTGPGGLRGTVDTARWPLDGTRREILIRLEDGKQVMAPVDSLRPLPGGGELSEVGAAEVEPVAAALASAGSDRVVVPVVAEEVTVGKREVETGRVRVTKLVHEEQQVIDQPLAFEEVVVERVPVNRIADGPVAVRQDGETLVVPLLEEVLVVEKRLMVREEVRISKRRTETHRPETVTVRKEDVKIERIPAANGDDGTTVAKR
jgi:uncharacterized protein (TIGR02271 family)